jgi:CRP-like cAMP-binding protein
MKRHKSVAHTTNMISRLKSVETWDDHGNSFSAVFHRLHDKEKQTSIEWSDNGFPMFNPKNVWRRRWDIIIMVLILYNALYLPQELVFDELPERQNLPIGMWDILNYIADTFFILDVIVTFRTGIEEKDNGVEVIVMEASAVATEYSKGWLAIDIASIGIPYGLDRNFTNATIKSIFKGLALLKMLRLLRLGRLLNRLVKIQVKYKQMARITSLLITYVFFNYILGCGLYWIGGVNLQTSLFKTDEELRAKVNSECGDDGKQICTYQTQQFDSKDTFGDRLATNTYYSMTTATSVGFGDLNAGGNIVEMVILIFAFMATMFITSIITGNMLALFDRMQAGSRRHSDRLEAVEEFVLTHEIEPTLAEHIRETIDYEWQLNKFFDTNSVLELLPKHLRKELLLHINKVLMIRVPFFQDQDESIMKEIVEMLRSDIALAGDTIIHEGQNAERMFFINVGSVYVMAPHALYHVATLEQYSYFGEIGLLVTHGRHSTTIKAKKRCRLSTLSKEDVETLLKVFPDFSMAFRKEALRRMKLAQSALAKARPSMCSEHRLMIEVVKAHSIASHDDVKTYAVLQLLERGTTGKYNKVGPKHVTPRSRGADPVLKYIQTVVFHIHKGVTMADVYLDITFYQVHSWRNDTYLGSARIKPAAAEPGKVDYRWHYLEDHRPRSEWDNLWRVINEQAPIGKEDYDLGQVLVRLVRHRDGSGSVAKIRALQAMKELAMLEHELEILTGAVTGTRKVVNKLLKSKKKGNYVDNGSSSTASLLSNPSPPSSPQQNREVLTEIKLPSTENSSILLEKSKLLATSINRLAEKVVIKKGLMSPPP